MIHLGVWAAIVFTVGMLLMSGILSLIFDPDEEESGAGHLRGFASLRVGSALNSSEDEQR